MLMFDPGFVPRHRSDTPRTWPCVSLLLILSLSVCCERDLKNEILDNGNGEGKAGRSRGQALKDAIMMDSSYINSIFEWKTELGISSQVRIIPNHHYVSSYLNAAISKRFVYVNEVPGNVVSILVTPCTSVLLWTVKYWPMPHQHSYTNFSKTAHHRRAFEEPQLLKAFRTDRSGTFYDLKSRRGVYTVDIKPLYGDSYVHLYALSGEEPLKIPSSFIETSNINPGVPRPRMTQRRLRGNRLQVRWEPSAFNPQQMKYCIVVNSERDFSTLCQAQGTKFGVLPPDLMHVSYYYFPFQKPTERTTGGGYSLLDQEGEGRTTRSTSQSQSGHRQNYPRDMVIGCVNRKTSYILHNLKEGKLYYFNVFIKDSSTNLTYPYLRTNIKYQSPKNLSNGITDSKAKKVMISNKPTLVKFNLKNPCSELSMYVMPCQGGRVTFQVIHAFKSIIEFKSDELNIVKIAMPSAGRYYIRLQQDEEDMRSTGLMTANNRNSSSRPLMVELYLSKRNKRFPLPKLPKNTQLTEDIGRRSCDSVSIRWMSSPDPKDNEYCIFLKEESRKMNFYFKKPNQCDLERSLNVDPYVTHSLCVQRTVKSPGQYLSQTVRGLDPGKIYIVQLIVRRHKGKSLSYDFLQVSTLGRCFDPNYGY